MAQTRCIFDPMLVKSNFEESFEKIGDEKEITGFDVDCDSNDLRLRAPAGSSQEGSKSDYEENRHTQSNKDDED